MSTAASSKRDLFEQLNKITKEISGSSTPLAPGDPWEVDHIIELVEEWASMTEIYPGDGDSPPDSLWENSAFPPLIRMISANLESCGVDMSEFQTADDCLHPPVIEHPSLPGKLLTVDQLYPCRLLFDLLLKCYLARSPWNLCKASISELRAGLMELGFAWLSGALFKAEGVLKNAVRQAEKEANAVKSRGDQLDKAAFQTWLKKGNVIVSKIDELRDLRGVPNDIARILQPVDKGGRAESTIKDWYREIRPGTLKGGRPKKKNHS